VSDVDETPDMLVGRLREALHIGAYSVDRAMADLKTLATGNLWCQVSPGYTPNQINQFLRDHVDLSGFNLKDKHPEVVATLKSLFPEPSNRAIAEVLGVSHTTVNQDLTTGNKFPPDGATARPELDPDGNKFPPEVEPPSLDLPLDLDEDLEDDDDECVEQVERNMEDDDGTDDDEERDEDEDGDEADEEEIIVAPEGGDGRTDPRDVWHRWREAYPEFVHPAIEADDFVTICEALDTKSEAERLAYRQRWATHDLNALAELLDETPIPTPDPITVEGRHASARWDKYFLELSILASSITHSWAALMDTWPPARKHLALDHLRQWHATLGQWMTELEEEVRDAENPDEAADQ
jgi:hypothetical protein